MSNRIAAELLPFGLACLLLTIAGLGCDDESSPCHPELPAGRISGQVVTGGSLEDMLVVFTRIPDESTLKLVIQTELDSTGGYSKDLPRGQYIVGLEAGWYRYLYEYSSEGLSYGNSPPDTLLIDQEHSHGNIDFDLGSLTFNIILSSALDGETGTVHLYRRHSEPVSNRSRRYVNSGGGEISNGICQFEVSGILPGEYKAEIILGRRIYLCSCPWDGEHVWYPGTRDSTDSPWIEVSPGANRELNIELGSSPARLEGEIVGAWLDLGHFEEPDIAVYDTDSLLVMGRRRIEEDGTFALDYYLPGKVKLLAYHDNIQQWIGGDSFASAGIFDLINGSTTAGIRHVESAFTLNISWPEGSIGTPRIYFYYADDRRLAHIWRPNTIYLKSGYHILNMRPGDYYMYLEPYFTGHYAWIAQWYDHADGMAEAQKITIPTEGDIVQLDIAIEAGASISGRLVQLSTPVDYYIVLTRADERINWGYYYSWDWRPEFSIEGVPAGDWKLGVWPIYANEIIGEIPPDNAYWYPGTSNWDDAGVLTITGDTDLTDIELTIQ
jgi:hypothetical protein